MQTETNHQKQWQSGLVHVWGFGAGAPGIIGCWSTWAHCVKHLFYKLWSFATTCLVAALHFILDILLITIAFFYFLFFRFWGPEGTAWTNEQCLTPEMNDKERQVLESMWTANKMHFQSWNCHCIFCKEYRNIFMSVKPTACVSSGSNIKSNF